MQNLHCTILLGGIYSGKKQLCEEICADPERASSSMDTASGETYVVSVQGCDRKLVNLLGCHNLPEVDIEFTESNVKLLTKLKFVSKAVVVVDRLNGIPKSLENILKILTLKIGKRFLENVCLVVSSNVDEGCQGAATVDEIVANVRRILSCDTFPIFYYQMECGSIEDLKSWMFCTRGHFDCRKLGRLDPIYQKIEERKERSQYDMIWKAIEVNEVVRVRSEHLNDVFGHFRKVGQKRRIEDDGSVVMRKKKVVGYTLRRMYKLQQSKYCLPWISDEWTVVDRRELGSYSKEEFVLATPNPLLASSTVVPKSE